MRLWDGVKERSKTKLVRNTRTGLHRVMSYNYNTGTEYLNVFLLGGWISSATFSGITGDISK